ncbi:MAG TPA: serine/threonine-protein kinase [Candidatus Polarisedimenticolia bacterium]|nr:serine/threonine-protein kinase [Candidatus Polarisedimenticolia bacterium]
MQQCLSCSSALSENSRFCPSCGARNGGISGFPTRLAGGRDTPTSSSRSSDSWGRSSSDPLAHVRFLPGSILGGRYRIHGPLGRGGMGEVYRADDLKLGQPVALKLLPESLASDTVLMARFLSEVRIARQISHPNVCRVYDLTEVDGVQVVSMEFIDGEDLASLLRRIGRLPKDKAVQIARQLCAGVAAAHEKGVVHRDLKPANVMVDGRGKVRITDFGLAGFAADLAGGEVRAGTPAYMAPEQLAGREVSVRSDLYSLGLVLYEMFTGRAAFDAPTLAELTRAHQETAPVSPSSILDEIDPVVERVILRCLEKDPRDRPVSALAVAAALPGGDPLAAALEAGETPSPEMVAAAGAEGGLRPSIGLACLAGLVAGIGLIFLLGSRIQLYRRVPLDKPPEVLLEEARNILARVGYDAPPVDTYWAFAEDSDYLRYLSRTDKTAGRWNRLATARPPAIYLYYRQSPRLLEPENRLGYIDRDDPPLTFSGMATLALDTKGRLVKFEAVPPQRDQETAEGQPDWPVLFQAAGLDPAAFSPVESTWTPPVYADVRAAWEGAVPEWPGVSIRVEAAGFQGRPVYFDVLGPWSRETRMVPSQISDSDRLTQRMLILLLLGVLAGAALLARSNLRQGRGDRKGAFRLGAAVFVTSMVIWTLRADHVPSVAEFAYLFTAFCVACGSSTLVWLIYIALEPYVRRRWPASIISWNRLLAGRFRDPLVGRDVLIGMFAGVGFTLVGVMDARAHQWLGLPTERPFPINLDCLQGAQYVIANLLRGLVNAVTLAMMYILLLLILRVIFRREWLAVGVWITIFTALFAFSREGSLVVHLVCLLAAMALILTLMLRSGLLATFAAVLMQQWAFLAPMEPSGWYAGASVTLLLTIAGLAVYAFYLSLAGRPLLRRDPFQI